MLGIRLSRLPMSAKIFCTLYLLGIGCGAIAACTQAATAIGLSPSDVQSSFGREMPMTSHSDPGGITLICSCRASTRGGSPPSTLTMNENCSGGFSTPMSSNGQMPCVWPMSKHSSSGFTLAAFMAERSLPIFS